MHSKDAKEPSEQLSSHGRPRTRPVPGGQPGRSAQSTQQPKRSGHPVEPSVQTAPSTKPTDPLPPQPPEPASLSQSEKEAIQSRAKGRARVPLKFRDSFKRFFFSPTGGLKVLRLGLLIGSAVCFIIAEAHESYIVITVLETCIVLFFILTYMLTLHRLMTYMHWPLLDLINSFITTVFLLIVAVLAMQEKERRHLFYVGGSLCLTAVIVCLIDATVVTEKMRNLMKQALRRLGGETSSSPDRAEPTQESEALIPPPSPAPPQAPPQAPPRAPSRAPLRAPAARRSSLSSHH